MPKSKRKKTGRPRIDINLEEVTKLGALQCTDEEMAAHFGVSIGSIKNRKKTEEFLAAYEKGKGSGKLSLRRLLWLHAQRHHGAAIFLSKNLLGYSDQRNLQIEGEIKHSMNYPNRDAMIDALIAKLESDGSLDKRGWRKKNGD